MGVAVTAPARESGQRPSRSGLDRARSRDHRGHGRSRGTVRVLRTHLSVVLVVFSLCWLGFLAVYVPHNIRVTLRELSQTIDPATGAAADLQLALSREGANTRAFLLTGGTQYAAAFHAARAARRDAYLRAHELADRAAPGIHTLVVDAGTALEASDERLDTLYGGKLPPDAYIAELHDHDARFTQATALVSQLHRELSSEASQRREAVIQSLSTGSILALSGVLLGILASVSVVRLNVRQRAIARSEQEARAASERAQAEAERRREQLELMTDTWTRLIRGFSHDLKNPLGAADGYLSMLAQGRMGALSPEQERAVAQSRHSLRNAMDLAQDLVRLARAEAADLDVHRVPMNVCDVVASVVDDYRAQASAKGLAIRTDLPSPPARVQSDPARVGQILENLLGNAIKYTTDGSVTVRVGHRVAASGTYCVVVDVSDTGPGIPREHHQRIFREFERLDTTHAGGTGIGLAMSERLAHLLGGTITLESELRRGATFTLWLPADQHA